jgi:protease-4
MARTRDIVVAVIIIGATILALGFVGLVFIGLLGQGTGDGFSAGFGDKVGVIEVSGAIYEYNGREVIRQIERWADNSSIKAIVLHVNSNGGGAAIFQEMYDAVIRARQNKPVVAALASVAASGGYYVACGADRVIANPGTLTGSIGVIFQFHTIPELLDKIGVETETIKSGELKDVGAYSHRMTKKEELMLRSVVMDTYEQFVEVVATGRQMDKDEVYPLADGSVFTGLQAYNLGMVDSLGGLSVAIEVAADLAGIEGEPNVVRPFVREKLDIFDLLGTNLGGLAEKVESQISGPRLLYLYQ